ncbi:MAG: hypothetical protein M3Y06_06195, partial [Actinomycetota bacterium]|nr:hypothetical protein [Actinomycetota bacterium]
GWSVGPVDPELPLLDDDVPTALVVMGDGSARRAEKSPGYLDDRAVGFDARISQTLADGVGDRLHFPFGDEGLLAAGVPVWGAVSRLIEARDWDAELLYDDAPYGVGYFVAAWTQRG